MMRMKYNKIFLVSLSVLAASCSKDVPATLSGDGVKTPLAVSTSISDPFEIRPATKAQDGEFTFGDDVVAYIQHVRRADAASAWDAISGTGVDPRLAGLRVASLTAGNPVVYNLSSTDTQGLYWDDFSNSSSADTDLRTADASSNPLHALQVKYAYCYNGGSGSLTPASGILDWTVDANQNTAGTKTSDLLWSPTQVPVVYSHETTRSGLMIPFTHALSKVTVNVTCTDGFASTYKLDGAAVTLKSFNTKASLDGPAGTITPSTPADVVMAQGTTATALKCSYTAIIAPTTLTEGDKLAVLSNLDGNDYDVTVTAAMLADWASRLTSGMTQSGVNYELNITVAKQQITVSATITDWVTVTGETAGKISFANDVTDTGEIVAELNTGGFDVYQLKTGKLLTNDNFGDKVTTVQSGVYDPIIYWPNGTDSFYFRALSPKGSTTAVQQGTDILWGTSGMTAIAPRTGDVPLDFEHPLSKITIKVIDVAAESTNPDAKLDLNKATIAIESIKTEGTLALSDGVVTPSTPGSISGFYAANDASGDTASPLLKDYVVIPQSIENSVQLTITLADGTRYKAQLNSCLDEDSAKIAAWKRGKHYTYTISIGKEEITFRASIQDWDPVTGSGNATIDWD